MGPSEARIWSLMLHTFDHSILASDPVSVYGVLLLWRPSFSSGLRLSKPKSPTRFDLPFLQPFRVRYQEQARKGPVDEDVVFAYAYAMIRTADPVKQKYAVSLLSGKGRTNFHNIVH